MTRGRLAARVAAQFGLTNESGNEEYDLLREWAQEGVIQVLLKTHCRVDVNTLTLTANQTEYRIDDDILAVLDVKLTVDSQQNPFRLVSLDEIIEKQRLTSAADGASWIAIEGDLMVVYPAPTTSTTLRYYFVARPTDMSQDTHDPSNATYGGIKTEYHHAIEAYMQWRASEYDERKGNARPLSAEDYRAKFESACAEVRRWKNRQAGRRLKPGRVGYPHSGYPTRNDVYPVR